MSLNVLVVDDSRTVRAVIAKTLQIAEVPVNELHQAANGQEGLQALHEHDIGLVFADINMPVMNGVEMVEKMEEEGLLGKVPVVIVSTEGSVTRIEELRSKGIAGYLRKPFTPESLREVVNQIMGEQP